MKVVFSVEFVILVCILFIILYGHLFLSCSKRSPYLLLEGLQSKKTKEGLQSKKTKEGFHNRDHFDPLIFSRTSFKPECCPTTYSNSQGCACISNQQYEYLIKRGGNNVPYSEY
jgi:hypothetical protein